ncbi:FlhC family transcriptional regulator [Piscirickettsia litoralis]|uniref:Flagellar transcriptional regulator FlhC n=1 Tax=Piscirickettsia litoralis TaxID=1891921 RepID=A0ABX2ZXJ5_9GAMM|nr:FlhC family transcriptional regulator [Piscirickettsia litoralis]ODN41337.1 hypothetical protein BGC07_16330 [Piscirickettsia litoralis]
MEKKQSKTYNSSLVSNEDKVAFLMMLGLRSRWISGIYGVATSRVRSISKTIRKYGFSQQLASGSEPTSVSIICSRGRMIEASLLVHFYKKVSENFDKREVDLEAFLKAYKLYVNARHSVGGMNEKTWSIINAQQAYVLLNELHLGESIFQACHVCGCNYYLTLAQTAVADDCPFCRPPTIHHYHKKRSKFSNVS